MGAAAYNRGSRSIAADADALMPAASARATLQAHKDEAEALRMRVAALERDLRRARRCLAAERFGREQLGARLRDEERANAFCVGILCRIAFAADDLEREPC